MGLKNREAWCPLLPAVQLLPLQVLHYDRNALPTADAGRRKSIPAFTPPQAVKQRDKQACAGGAKRVPQRDCAAIHVDLLAIESELPLHCQVLGREGLVHFNQVEVIK